MTTEDVQQELAEALKPVLGLLHEPLLSVVAQEWAEKLLAPGGVVERIARQRAAAELEATANDSSWGEYAKDWLRNRADALRAQP